MKRATCTPALPTLYHGTSRPAWRSRQPVGMWYLSAALEDALNYAYEAAAFDEGEGRTPEPIIVTVDADSLAGLVEAGAQLHPDWGWVDGLESRHDTERKVPGWADSFAACGCLSLEGLTKALKKQLPLRDAADVEAEMATVALPRER